MRLDVGYDTVDDAGGHHEPHGSRRMELPHERFDRRCARSADTHQTLDRCGIPVVHNTSVTAAEEARDHPCAHSSKTYHAELHGNLLRLLCCEKRDALSRGGL
jgi:hypothetical protein